MFSKSSSGSDESSSAFGSLFAITKSGTSKTIPGFSLPKEPIVVAGKVELESLGNQMQVKQFTQKAAIQWKEFNIGKDASLEFLQPNSKSSILNQVSNTDPSFILGKISSNGNVFVTNRNGIFFGKNATVDVGGLVASSLEIEIDDFINNEFLFKKSVKGGQIVNEGKLHLLQEALLHCWQMMFVIQELFWQKKDGCFGIWWSD